MTFFIGLFLWAALGNFISLVVWVYLYFQDKDEFMIQLKLCDEFIMQTFLVSCLLGPLILFLYAYVHLTFVVDKHYKENDYD